MHKLLLLCGALLYCTPLLGQNVRVLDSLNLALQNVTNSEERIAILNQLTRKYASINPDSGLLFGREALVLSRKAQQVAEEADAHQYLGLNHYYQGNYDSAEYAFRAAMRIQKRREDQKKIEKLHNYLGAVNSRKGNHAVALQEFEKSLQTRQLLQDTLGMAGSYNNIANIYKRQGDLIRAAENYHEALKIFERAGSRHAASVSNNLGNIAMEGEDLEQALVYYRKALTQHQKTNDPHGASKALSNMALVFSKQKKYDKALETNHKAVALKKKMGYEADLSSTYQNIANIYSKLEVYDSTRHYLKAGLEVAQKAKNKQDESSAILNWAMLEGKQGNYRQATLLAERGLEIAEEINSLFLLRDGLETLHKAYANLGQHEKAYEYQQYWVQARDSLNNEEKTKRIAVLEAQYTFRQTEDSLKKANELQTVALEKEKVRSQAQQRITWGIGGLLVVALAFGAYIYRSRQTQKRLNKLLKKQKDNLHALNKDLKQTQQELMSQNEYIEEQRLALAKQTELTQDSIRSALTIQQALLPFEERMGAYLREFFILYLPRDIVSGDFYWNEQVEDTTYLIAADCTGHGVPGAFMSLIGISLLNKIVLQDGVTQPKEILSTLDEQLNYALRHSGESGLNSGMDIALVAWQSDDTEVQLVFAGAKRPLYYVQEDKIQVVKGTRRSIGGIHHASRPYEQHALTLPAETCIYLGSDGFADQNNSARKKFGSGRLRELLQKVAPLPLSQQREKLNNALEAHMQGTKQRDDILWIGVRL